MTRFFGYFSYATVSKIACIQVAINYEETKSPYKNHVRYRRFER